VPNRRRESQVLRELASSFAGVHYIRTRCGRLFRLEAGLGSSRAWGDLLPPTFLIEEPKAFFEVTRGRHPFERQAEPHHRKRDLGGCRRSRSPPTQVDHEREVAKHPRRPHARGFDPGPVLFQVRDEFVEERRAGLILRLETRRPSCKGRHGDRFCSRLTQSNLLRSLLGVKANRLLSRYLGTRISVQRLRGSTAERSAGSHAQSA